MTLAVCLSHRERPCPPHPRSLPLLCLDSLCAGEPGAVRAGCPRPGGQPAHPRSLLLRPLFSDPALAGTREHPQCGRPGGVIPAGALPSPLWSPSQAPLGTCTGGQDSFLGLRPLRARGQGWGASGRELSPALYSRVHTCTGAEARLSVRCSCPPSPLRAVTQMAYFLPGSKALWGTEARGEEQDGSALRPPLRQCDPGGGRPGAGVTRVGVIPGLVARHPPQRPGCGLRAGLSSSLACPVLGRTQARGGCSVAGSWCSDSRGQLRATEGKGLTGRPPPTPALGRAAHEAGPGVGLLRVPSALGGRGSPCP